MLNTNHLRTIVSGLRRYSQEVKDLFKFYSDDETEYNKHTILDEKDYSRFLSHRALSQKPAPTRQLIVQTERSTRKISRNLAEGMPNEATFPFTNLELTTRSGKKLVIGGGDLDLALQYIPPKGLPCLISELHKFQQELHKPPPLPRNLLVTNGAQHGIHLCTELLVDEGDPVISTEYSYTGLHYILKPYHVEYIGIPEDKDGLIPELLESVLNKRLALGLKMPRVLYLIPTVSNPTGFLMSEERRRRIYETACKYDLIIVEDEVYMFLNYTDEVIPSFLSLDTTGRVLRIDSFSKVISAGLRVGWLTGPAPLLMYAELASLSQMLHPCSLAQIDGLTIGYSKGVLYINNVVNYLNTNYLQSVVYNLMSDRATLATQLLSARQFYKNQRDRVNNALKEIEDLIEWEEPAGGYFHWLKIRGIDDVQNMVFNTAFDHGLMLEPGQSFKYNNETSSPYIRLTFTRMIIEELEENIRTIGNIIREEKKLSGERTFCQK